MKRQRNLRAWMMMRILKHGLFRYDAQVRNTRKKIKGAFGGNPGSDVKITAKTVCYGYMCVSG